MQVHKETLQINDDVQERQVGHIVHVGQQKSGDQLQLWFENIGVRSRFFTVHGTGHEIAGNEQYVGTVLDNHLQLVWHVYEVLR